MPSANVIDVDAATFQVEVVDRSHERPVVVDFWAAWCGPCRTLGPMLESAVDDRDGEVLLAKVDVDRNPSLAQTYGVQGIPQVLGFRDGSVVDQFTGVVPAVRVAAFIHGLAPNEVDRAIGRARRLDGDEAIAEYRRALELEPGSRAAALGLADLLVRDDPTAAEELVRPHRPDPDAERILARIELAEDSGDIDELRTRIADGDTNGATRVELGRALVAREEHGEAIEHLLAAVASGGADREAAREHLVKLFAVLGDEDERVRDARPRLARALY